MNSVSLCSALFFRPSTLQTRGGTSPRYRPTLNHPLKRYSTILPLSIGCQLSAVSSPVNRLFVLSPFNFKLPALSGVEGSTVNLLSSLDALDAASSLSPLSATLTKNTGGWGTPLFSANSVPSAFKSTRALPSTDPFAAPHHPPHCFSLFHQSPVTSHQSQATKSFTIRTYAKRPRNPFTMNTYKKTGGPLHSLLTAHYPRLTSFPLKPQPQMAHLYLCTRKKGPAAREPRYSPCAAS